MGKKRHINQWNGKEEQEIKVHKYAQLILTKVQRRKDSLENGTETTAHL